MKKHLYIFLVFLCPIFIFSQKVEVIGELKTDSIEVTSFLKLSGYVYFGGNDDGVIMSDQERKEAIFF